MPGGIREDRDTTPVDTALREAKEEVSLDPHLVELVSVLPPTVSGWNNLTCVTPVVCLLKCKVEELSLVCNPEEVDEISWIPIRTFIESHSMEPVEGSWRDIPVTLAAFRYTEPESKQQCYVWGLTAQICITVSAIALNQLPTFPNYKGYSLFDVQHSDVKTVTVVMYPMVLTSKHMEECKEHTLLLKSRLPISQWHNAITSKL